MSLILFDFDSTLIRVESLEGILAEQLEQRPELALRVAEITRAGMDGKLNFGESLRQRLEIAAPNLGDVIRFGNRAIDLLSEGMAELIAQLKARSVAVHIVSGGLREAILPVAQFLGIPNCQVHAVQLDWHLDGRFAGISPLDPFSRSKIEGSEAFLRNLPGPKVGVGDGMTDFALFQQGLIDHFVAYTEHARREAVLATGSPEAPNVEALASILEEWL